MKQNDPEPKNDRQQPGQGAGPSFVFASFIFLGVIFVISIAMFSLGGVVAQNSLQPDPNQQNPDAWIDDLKKNTQELPEQDLARAQALIKQLGSSVYREREQATRELLLLPRRVVAHLADHRKHASPEVRHRASWVVEQFRISGEMPPFDSYIGRVAGLDQQVVREHLEPKRNAIDELLNRLPAGEMTAEPGIWARLYPACTTAEQRSKVTAMFAATLGSDPTVKLYQALLDSYPQLSPARSALIDSVGDSAPLELVLELAQASAGEQDLGVRSARDRVLRRLRKTLDAASMLERFSAAPDASMRVLLLELVNLAEAPPEQRAAWLALGEQQTDPKVRDKFVGMAAREGLHEVLDSPLMASGGRARFTMLAAVGRDEHWRRELARVDNDVTQAVTWLPWSGLPVASQRDLLVGLLESANGDIRRAAIGMLAGYGDPALVDLALGWLATAPDRTPVALELLVAHAWLLPERAPDALKQPWFSGASASAKAAIARWYDTPESDALLEKLAHSDDPDAAGIAVREVVLRANTFFARQLAVAHCMRPFPLTASTIAALEPTPESAFATLKRIVDQRQPKMLSQERSSPDYLLALSLALHNDDALREALKHGTLAGAQDRAALLALYRDEEGAKARADALKSYSQGLLHLTPLLVHLGDEATVIAALKTAAESRSIPASIDIVALTRALASDAAQPSMRSLIDICTKPNDDKLFAACALPLSLNITREPYLDLLASIAIRRDTESFRRLLVMAAAGSPALDTAWINARREAWESSKRESTDRVFALLDAIAERSESALLGFALDAMREGGDTNMRLPSLFAAARLGSRHALIAAVNETLGVESALGEPLRFPSSPNAAAFRLGDYCAGIPGSVKGMDRRIAFWQSTRHLWAWDVTSGMFTRRTGP